MAEEKKIEEVTADVVDDVEDVEDEDDQEEMPDLQQAEPEAESQVAAEAATAKQSRSEKKARKALSKLGLVAVDGIARVTIRKSKNILFVFQKPDVMKSPASETYIVFGEARFEDLSQNAMVNAAEKLVKQQAQTQKAPEPAPVEVTTKGAEEVKETPKAEAATEEKKADAGSISEKDIDVVAKQANVSRDKAIEALKKTNGDIVNALMELTM
ncbi:nascent polypeptide-associated complex subunit alpha [Salpingoeca rosetta]|uniref:Nascent polypeptide-associated complex subunit alpha n=1 Tax=Salpingoeca rosetta (strain ATCC 50818 / BSB-021) TaxID=946362 RepID=F2UMM0_SALR5|nr:nascent polypeptide-associated complex subunit alpha [Salpingoeca rosetta]EGD78369.1 nascent polypeptide-associated complex subunit alpha [Salpingoeca rosetta]|eukprot:XP_004989692.1 nascent polypeptide-associated complex subunit alpha [Salpingoeca rosetta]